MKKLLFSLVAAAACGAVTAAPVEFTGLTAFDPLKNDAGAEVGDGVPGYWEINYGTEPELAVSEKVEEQDVALGYLKINTGSTPLWRTFSGVTSKLAVTNATLDAAGVPADGKVVSSDVKLTACTEWPKLTDFANEKLALFLFDPEEGDTSGKTAGLYAVGGAMVDPDGEGEAVATLTRTAYKLTVTGDITNNQGWATISIKTYGDIYKTSGADKLAGFVIAVNGKIATRAEATGFTADDLGTTAATRNTNGTLIPAAMTTTAATIAGLGFQGEGGIDNVDLAAADFAVDAVAMTVDLTDATLTEITGAKVTSLSADGNLEFDPDTQTITFKVSTADNMVVTVKLGDDELTATNGVYSFTPAADAELTVTAAPAAFQIGNAKYATLDKALAGLTSGSTLKLLGTLKVSDQISFIDADNNPIAEVVLDLNGQTIEAEGEFGGNLIYNQNGTKLTIIDSSTEKTGTVDGAVANEGELIINAGKFNGAVANDGTLTDNGGKFKETDGLPEVTGKEYRDDDADDYYTLEDVAGSGDDDPEIEDAIGDDVGKVEETTDGEGNKTATVTVTNASTSVTIQVPTGYQGTVNVVVPPTVDTITGLGAATLTVKAEGVDITGAFSKTTVEGVTTLDLNPNGEVEIDGETIKVEPQLVEDTTAEGTVAPFEVPADGAEANVAAIPGLTYELVTTDDLDVEFGSIVENGEVVPGAKKKATGKRVNLKDGRANRGDKGFYKVKVSK